MCAPGKSPGSPSDAQQRGRSGLLASLSPEDMYGVGALACLTKCAAAATLPRPANHLQHLYEGPPMQSHAHARGVGRIAGLKSKRSTPQSIPVLTAAVISKGSSRDAQCRASQFQLIGIASSDV